MYDSKTTLFFIIRDFFGGGTPFSRLQTKLIDGIRRVWDDMRKPDKFKDTKIEDLFDFEFCPLPDKRHKPNEFIAAVGRLRARYYLPACLVPLGSWPTRANSC
jgi:hypothetical protein